MSKKLNIILDLDETLISAEPTEEYDFEKYKNKASKFNFEPMEGYYIIFERPGLQEFLDFLFENFNISIWTAATQSYCLFIIEKIILTKPNRKIDWIFFSYHCNASRKIKNGTKDLSMLWDIYKIPGYNQNNTVILDDYEEVHSTQSNNCIIAKPFKFSAKDSENDDFFKKLVPKLKKYLLEKNTIEVKRINKKLN